MFGRFPLVHLLTISVGLVACASCQTVTLQDYTQATVAHDELLTVLESQLDRDLWQPNRGWTPLTEWRSRSKHFPAPSRLRWSYNESLVIRGDSQVLATEFGQTSASVEDTEREEEDGPVENEEVAEIPDGSKRTGLTPGNLHQQLDAATVQLPASAQETTWDGFWPLNALDLLGKRSSNRTQQSEPNGLRCLAVLAKRDRLVGWNAAILWAQRAPAAAIVIADRLERLVVEPPEFLRAADKASTSPKEKTRISPAMRGAAAEAWCLVLACTAPSRRVEDLSEALAPAGRLLQKPDLPILVRGELFRGCARWIPPDVIPRLANALRNTETGQRAPVEIRRAAMEACLMFALWQEPDCQPSEKCAEHTAGAGKAAVAGKGRPFEGSDWPSTVWNGSSDPDGSVRRIYGQWLAVARPPEALHLLQKQLADGEPRVRESALVSFGLLGTPDARRTLRQYAQRSEPRVRAFVVKGLAEWGTSEINRFVNDTSATVRQAVATELKRFPEARSATLLQRLLADRNSQVQQTAVQSVSTWPDALAIPVLVHGLRDSTLANRKRCLAQLRRRLGCEIVFAVEAPREERIRSIVKLVYEKHLPTKLITRLQQENAGYLPTLSQQRQDELAAQLDAFAASPPESTAQMIATDALGPLNDLDIAFVERYAAQAAPEQADVLYRQLLPEFSPVYAALKSMETSDVLARRRAAQTLGKIGAENSLSPQSIRRLQKLLAHEQDGLVWRSAMQAVMLDANEEAAQLALLAVNHTWPDIRVLGCQYIGRHGQPQQAIWLIPLFADLNRTVQIEAVKAAGLCRNPIVLDNAAHQDASSNLRGLRPLLSHPDPRLRLEAAVSMSRLGDTQGMQELMRLSYHKDAKLRQEIIRKIGTTGQSRFIEHLIRLAWTEKHDLVKRAILASLEKLAPAQERPAGLATIESDDDRIERWVTWWQRRSQLNNLALQQSESLP